MNMPARRSLLAASAAWLAGCAGPRVDTRFSAISQGPRIDLVVLHYTALDFDDSLRVLTQQVVSSHYLVDVDPPTIYRLVAEDRRANHAGISAWAGRVLLNMSSIGIEIVNPGHEFGYRPFPDAQMAAVIVLLGEIRSRWTVEDRNIIGHSDVAPDRKIDPGELFPWKRLAQAGHGLWLEPPPAPGAPLAEGEEGAGVFALQAGLTRLGYDSAPSGKFDAHTTNIVSAFQRHWVQSRFDGVADGETRARLIALLRLGT